MNETWKAAPGYEGVYEVSCNGRVRRILRAQGTSLGILKPNFGTHGYSEVKLSKNGKSKTVPIHRLVAIAFLGRPKMGFHVNHKNGRRSDARLVNLEYLTPGANNLHACRVLGAIRTGPRGEKARAAKLTAEEVLYIREKHLAGQSMASLGREFSVTIQAIWRIIRRKNWKHV